MIDLIPGQLKTIMSSLKATLQIYWYAVPKAQGPVKGQSGLVSCSSFAHSNGIVNEIFQIKLLGWNISIVP